MAKAKPSLAAAIKDDPVEFTRKLLTEPDGTPAEPHTTQIELLQGIQSTTVACCGRQWGKSKAMGWYGTWFSTTHANREVYVIAPTLDQSRIIFNEIAFHFRRDPLASLVQGKIVDYPFPKISLANGTNIHARGANSPQYIRGKPIHLAIVDEASFVKDGTITKVVEPMFTVTGKMQHSAMILISTPFGLGDFYEYFERAGSSDRMSRFRFSSADNPHADAVRLEEIKNRYGEDSLLWRTEYLAEFVDDDLAVFSPKDVKWAYENYAYSFPVPATAGHRYVQGVDLANVRDYFVSSLLDISDPLLFPLVRTDRFQKKGYTFYKNLVRQNYTAYHSAKTLLDATSLGESVVEDLKDINAQGYKFSQQSKYEIVQELARLFSEHRIAIPYQRDIIDELRFFSYKYTANKTLKMEASQGHDDIVMSLALAAHLALQPQFTGFFAGVTITPRASSLALKDPWSFDE